MKRSPLWVCSPEGRRIHRKRSYAKGHGLTLCGLSVTPQWMHYDAPHGRKCKRCAA